MPRPAFILQHVEPITGLVNEDIPAAAPKSPFTIPEPFHSLGASALLNPP